MIPIKAGALYFHEKNSNRLEIIAYFMNASAKNSVVKNSSLISTFIMSLQEFVKRICHLLKRGTR
jgi:hypothetical protein